MLNSVADFVAEHLRFGTESLVQPTRRSPMSVTVKFLPGKHPATEARSGEPILEVAARAGIEIPHWLLNGFLSCL